MIWANAIICMIWAGIQSSLKVIQTIRYFSLLTELQKQLRVLKRLWQLSSLTTGYFFLESFVMLSFCLGLLMGHDTFSSLCLVNFHQKHLWNVMLKTVKLLDVSLNAPSVSKTKIFLEKVSCPISRYLCYGTLCYRTDLHWTVFPEHFHM